MVQGRSPDGVWGRSPRSQIYTNNLQLSNAFLCRFVAESVLSSPHTTPCTNPMTQHGQARWGTRPSVATLVPIECAAGSRMSCFCGFFIGHYDNVYKQNVYKGAGIEQAENCRSRILTLVILNLVNVHFHLRSMWQSIKWWLAACYNRNYHSLMSIASRLDGPSIDFPHIHFAVKTKRTFSQTSCLFTAR